MAARRVYQTIGQIFAIPVVLATLSSGGLIFALLEDGIWDALSWLALSVPLVVLVICMIRGRAS